MHTSKICSTFAPEMKRTLLSIFFCSVVFALAAKPLPHYEMAYRVGGLGAMMMNDGKVDDWVGSRPILGGEFAVEFLPTGRWNCLQDWNNASVGVGAKVLNLGNDSKLGYAFAAYGYLNEPFYTSKHFVIGFRPSVGLAACTKTYSNTLPSTTKPYTSHTGANWSVGSVLNAYLAVELYMDFPIKRGFDITLSGGWHHISNGSIMHPNSGYNMFGGALGLRYTPGLDEDNTKHFGYEPPKPHVPRKLYDGVDKKWAVEISATGGLKQNYYADNQNGQKFFGAATLKAAAYWVPVSIFRIGGGVDAFYDGYYGCVSNEFATLPGNENATVTHFGKTYLKEGKVENCFRVGISIQPEFIIGNLTAGIHVGFYVFDPVKNLEPYKEAKNADLAGKSLDRGLFYNYDFSKASNYQDGWCYMQFVLKYHVLKHLFVQLGLKTHGVRAEFIDAGLGVAF